MTSRYVTLWWGRKDVPPTGLRSKLQQAKNSIQNAGDILHLRLQFLALWDRSGASKTFDGFGRLDDRAKELSNRLRGVERRGPRKLPEQPFSGSETDRETKQWRKLIDLFFGMRLETTSNPLS